MKMVTNWSSKIQINIKVYSKHLVHFKLTTTVGNRESDLTKERKIQTNDFMSFCVAFLFSKYIRRILELLEQSNT